MSYREYLRSEHWQKVKARAYERRDSKCKNKCKMCFSYGALELHHRTYKTLGRESLVDLVFLCRECHQTIHDYVKITDGKRNRSHLKASKGWNKYCSRNHLWSLRFKNPEEFKRRAQGFFKGYFSNRKNDRQQILQERAAKSPTPA